MKSYLFYDIETSGLHPVFDQILTFAAIRCDRTLAETERYAVTVRLRPDTVPSPGAFLTHGLSASVLARGESEYQAALAIHRLVNEPGTVSLGYNTLGFDNDFLRFTFYRNLLDPYTHQYADGCSRMDVLPVATLFRVFKPEILEWPELDGKPTLKLEHITAANRFETSAAAHDAMADVEATLELARRLAGEISVWEYCLGFFDKKTDEARVGELPRTATVGSESYRTGIMLSPSFGPDVMYLAPVLFLGHSRVYSNQGLWIRLDRDYTPHLSPGQEAMPHVIRRRYGESLFVLPPRDRFLDRLAPAQRDQCRRTLDLFAREKAWFETMLRHHRDYEYPHVPDIDPDAALYQDGFFSQQEKREMAAFHRGGEDEKLFRYDDLKSARVKTLAARILFRNFSSLRNSRSEIQDGFGTLMGRVHGSGSPGDVIRGFRGEARYTVQDGLRELAEARASYPDRASELDEIEALILRSSG